MKNLVVVAAVTAASVFAFNFSLFTFHFSLVNAQVPTGIDGITIDLSPENPVPGGKVQVTMQDYLYDLSSADIAWIVNGKKAAEGVGMNDITLTAPSAGQAENVEILIQIQNGPSIQKSLTIKSGSVDLVWESQGYAPPLYQGKQPFAYENTVKIVAMPHLADSAGVEIDPSTLVYNWTQDSTVLQSDSGYGKQSIEITGKVIPRPTTISVTVSTRDGSETANDSITLQAGSPSLVFYQDDPLYGVLYNQALGSQVSFSTQELTLLAAPYSFNMTASGGGLTYSWNINGTAQNNLSNNRSATLRVQDTSTDASYPVQLSVQSPAYILEGANAATTLNFQASNNNAQPSL